MATPEQVAAQARRMMRDARARKMVARFHEQWLDLGKLDVIAKDEKLYPGFAAVRGFMKEETVRFVEDTFWQGNGSAKKLFSSTTTFLNPELAKFLRLPAAQTQALKPGFQAVAMDPTQRTGLITQAGLLAIHAALAETSPVARGKFVLEQFMCVVVPPPPPDVANTIPSPLPGQTTRERFSEHAKAECASCHRIMDPVGFALESFDAAGRWRTMEGGTPVESTGSLVGTDVDGPLAGGADLGRRIATSDQAMRCLTRQWFRFAAGRPEVEADEPALAQLSCAFEGAGYDLRELPVALTQTDSFLFRPADNGGAR